MMTPKDFFEFTKKNNAKMIDLKFTDLLGTWQHCSFPIDTWDEDTFKDGVGFDGSSIRGWQGIHVSDMLAVPDPNTAVIDPFFKEPTVSVIANIVDPITKEDYSRDPRHIARKGTAFSSLTRSGMNKISILGCIGLIRLRELGTLPVSRSRTLDTSRALREATSR
jgi:glutamine synthetase